MTDTTGVGIAPPQQTLVKIVQDVIRFYRFLWGFYGKLFCRVFKATFQFLVQDLWGLPKSSKGLRLVGCALSEEHHEGPDPEARTGCSSCSRGTTTGKRPALQLLKFVWFSGLKILAFVASGWGCHWGSSAKTNLVGSDARGGLNRCQRSQGFRLKKILEHYLSIYLSI